MFYIIVLYTLLKVIFGGFTSATHQGDITVESFTNEDILKFDPKQIAFDNNLYGMAYIDPAEPRSIKYLFSQNGAIQTGPTSVQTTSIPNNPIVSFDVCQGDQKMVVLVINENNIMRYFQVDQTGRESTPQTLLDIYPIQKDVTCQLSTHSDNLLIGLIAANQTSPPQWNYYSIFRMVERDDLSVLISENILPWHLNEPQHNIIAQPKYTDYSQEIIIGLYSEPLAQTDQDSFDMKIKKFSISSSTGDIIDEPLEIFGQVKNGNLFHDIQFTRDGSNNFVIIFQTMNSDWSDSEIVFQSYRWDHKLMCQYKIAGYYPSMTIGKTTAYVTYQNSMKIVPSDSDQDVQLDASTGIELNIIDCSLVGPTTSSPSKLKINLAYSQNSNGGLTAHFFEEETTPGNYKLVHRLFQMYECHYSCSECSSTNTTECVKCSSRNREFDNNTNSCGCQSLTFDEGSAYCTPCDVTCRTCDNSGVCQSCVGTRKLENNTCICDDGFEEFNSNNQHDNKLKYCKLTETLVTNCPVPRSCPDNCTICNEETYECMDQCVQSNNQIFHKGQCVQCSYFDGECIIECPEGFEADSSSRQCKEFIRASNISQKDDSSFSFFECVGTKEVAILSVISVLFISLVGFLIYKLKIVEKPIDTIEQLLKKDKDQVQDTTQNNNIETEQNLQSNNDITRSNTNKDLFEQKSGISLDISSQKSQNNLLNVNENTSVKMQDDSIQQTDQEINKVQDITDNDQNDIMVDNTNNNIDKSSSKNSLEKNNLENQENNDNYEISQATFRNQDVIPENTETQQDLNDQPNNDTSTNEVPQNNNMQLIFKRSSTIKRHNKKRLFTQKP